MTERQISTTDKPYAYQRLRSDEAAIAANSCKSIGRNVSGTTLALEAILKDRPHDPREDRVLIYMLFDLIEALSKRAFPKEDMRVVMSARGQPGTYSEHPVGMWDVYWTMARN